MMPLILSLCLSVGQPPYEPVPAPLPPPIPSAPMQKTQVLLPEGPRPMVVIPDPPPVTSYLVVPTGPMSLCDFQKCFVPCPGHHEVCFVHPVSGKCVKVCFDLPDCCLKSMDVGRRDIVFHYCNCNIRIVFRILGSRVDVVSR
jgi:hypothetical protein